MNIENLTFVCKGFDIRQNFAVLMFTILFIFPLFAPAIQSVSLGVFCGVSFLLNYRIFKQNIKDRKRIFAFFSIIGFYLFQLLSYFWSNDKIQYLKEIQPNIVILLLPFVIFFLSDIEKLKTKINLYCFSFIISMTLFFLVWMQYMIMGLYDYQNYYPYGSYPWLDMVPHINNSYKFTDSINLRNYYNLFQLLKIYKGNLELSVTQGFLHSKRESLFLTHYAYVGMMINFSIVILLQNIINKKNNLIKLFLIMWTLFFVCFQFLLNSKTNKGILILIFLIYFFYYLNIKSKKIFYFFLLSLIVIFCIFLTQNYSSLIEYKFENNKFKGFLDFERYNIYKESFQILKSNFLFGVGLGDVSSVLNEKLKVLAIALHNDVNFKLSFNSHNEYFHLLLATGITGLFLFIVSIFTQLFMIFHSKSYLMFFFILILTINLLFENIFSRFNGAMFSSLFIVVNYIEYYGCRTD